MQLQDAKVLLVEDNLDSQEVVSRILKYLRVDTHIVASSEDAIDALGQHTFDLAVVDLALPQMDGWGLLNFVRNNPEMNHLPIVAITAYHSPEVAVKALEAGFNAYFPKPLDTTHFTRQLENIIKGI